MKDIALLKASHSNVSTRNFRREIPAHIQTIHMHGGTFSSDSFNPREYDGIVITGSSSSVLDETPWIGEAEKAVTTAVEQHSVPTLGVCWGAQLLAHALGGTVEQTDTRELGYRTVERTDSTHPIFHGIEDRFTAFQSHADYIRDIPRDGELLALSDDSKQAFSYNSAIGVQFHPEVDYRSATDLIAKYGGQKTTPDEQDKTVQSWALSKETSDVLRNFIHKQVQSP